MAADVFSWEPERRFDVVFFSFWLSHVPRSHFRAFWDLVRSCLAPSGRVFLIDNRTGPTPGIPGRDPYVAEYRADLHVRRLEDGAEYRVVKVTYQPEELTALLDGEGWQAGLDATEWFIFGSATPAPPTIPEPEIVSSTGRHEPGEPTMRKGDGNGV